MTHDKHQDYDKYYNTVIPNLIGNLPYKKDDPLPDQTCDVQVLSFRPASRNRLGTYPHVIPNLIGNLPYKKGDSRSLINLILNVTLDPIGGRISAFILISYLKLIKYTFTHIMRLVRKH